MLKNKLKNYMAKHEDGFTIIEVIIVLVIGAVIMLAVFLVVPQLQRTQRNSARQAYARQVLTAINQLKANDPSATSFTAAQITGITNVVRDPSTNNNYAITTPITTTTAAPSTTSPGNISIRAGASACGTNATTGLPEFISGNGNAVLISVEGTPALFCVTDQ